MITPSTTIDLGFALWQPWAVLTLLMQFGYVVFGFAFSPSCACCFSCGTNCNSGTLAGSYQLDIAGLSDDGTCTNCDEINGSYEVTPFCYTDSSPARCHFVTTEIDGMCGGADVNSSSYCGISVPNPSLSLALSDASIFVVHQYDIFSAFQETLGWRKIDAAPYDCALSGEVLAWNNLTSTRCNSSGSTCTVTAL